VLGRALSVEGLSVVAIKSWLSASKDGSVSSLARSNIPADDGVEHSCCLSFSIRGTSMKRFLIVDLHVLVAGIVTYEVGGAVVRARERAQRAQNTG
jgi:hypothetical protein